MVDEEWMECLRKGPVENFVGIPSGLIKVGPLFDPLNLFNFNEFFFHL